MVKMSGGFPAEQLLERLQKGSYVPETVKRIFAEADSITTPYLINCSGLARLAADEQRVFHTILPNEQGLEQILQLHPSEVFTRLSGLLTDYAWALFKTGYLTGYAAVAREGNVTRRGLDDAISATVKFLYNEGLREEQHALLKEAFGSLSAYEKDGRIIAGLIAASERQQVARCIADTIGIKVSEGRSPYVLRFATAVQECKPPNRPDSSGYLKMLKETFAGMNQLGTKAFAIGYQSGLEDLNLQRVAARVLLQI
ncbi:MAG: hypothetical protein HY518_00295 [Candidatus Aenigmarchaeota archaeon]|nr:hypothetical protein [Candidatus Aenigmarchaeota archaeon]